MQYHCPTVQLFFFQLLSVLKSQRYLTKGASRPATVVESEPAEPVQIMESGSALFIVEAGGHKCNETKSCPGDTTCCNNGGHTDTWGCCPHENGVCCADRRHCCPEGTVCDVKEAKCVIKPVAMVRILILTTKMCLKTVSYEMELYHDIMRCEVLFMVYKLKQINRAICRSTPSSRRHLKSNCPFSRVSTRRWCLPSHWWSLIPQSLYR